MHIGLLVSDLAFLSIEQPWYHQLSNPTAKWKKQPTIHRSYRWVPCHYTFANDLQNYPVATVYLPRWKRSNPHDHPCEHRSREIRSSYVLWLVMAWWRSQQRASRYLMMSILMYLGAFANTYTLALTQRLVAPQPTLINPWRWEAAWFKHRYSYGL